MPQSNHTITRCSGLVFRAVEGQPKQYELSFSSEDPDTRWSVPEILQHTAESVDLSVLTEMGSVLYHHGYDSVIGGLPVARIVRAWLDEAERKCRAIIEFDAEDEVAEKIRRKLENGMLRGVSVGAYAEWARLREGEVSMDGRFTGPARIAARWTPFEISLTPTPADMTVGVGKSMNFREEHNMEEENKTTEQGMPTAVPSMPEGVQRAAGATAAPAATVATAVPQAGNVEAVERARSADIYDICTRFGIDASDYIRRGVSVDTVRTDVLRGLSAENAPLPVFARASNVTVVAEELDKVRRAAVDGMLLRSGARLEKSADGARDFRGMSLRDIAVEVLRCNGHAGANRMSREEIFRAVCTPDSAFSAIAADVAHKSVSTAYAAATVTYPLWTQTGVFTDFKPTKMYRISEADEPELIPQGGEFPQSHMGDELSAMRQGVTYGKAFTLTREAFYNDDIGLLTRMPAAYVSACRRLINRLVYQLLTKNPVMLDGHTLFSTKHGNLCAVGDDPSRDAYSEARKLMRQQRDISGKQVLNIAPKFVLASSLDETMHEQMLVSIADPSSNNSGVYNPFAGKMQLIVDAELDAASGAQPYYFAGDPAMCDTIEVASLNGEDAPKVESQQAWRSLGIEFRVYDDKAVTLVDHRALVKNPGKSR